MNFKYVIGQKTDPYYNLAMEQKLLDFVDEQTGIIFLWQNDKTIVVGRNQNVNAECDVKAFTFWGGKIARRRSGGGAVYHDLGNLNYSILTTQLNKDKLRYQDLMVGLIETYGITATYNGRNDILLGLRLQLRKDVAGLILWQGAEAGDLLKRRQLLHKFRHIHFIGVGDHFMELCKLFCFQQFIELVDELLCI